MRYKQFFFTFLIAAISCGLAGEVDFSRYPKRKCWAAGGVVTITPAFDALKLTWNPGGQGNSWNSLFRKPPSSEPLKS